MTAPSEDRRSLVLFAGAGQPGSGDPPRVRSRVGCDSRRAGTDPSPRYWVGRQRPPRSGALELGAAVTEENRMKTIPLIVLVLALVGLFVVPVAVEGGESSETELWGGCDIARCASVCFERHCAKCESQQCNGNVGCIGWWCLCSDFECSARYWDVSLDPDALLDGWGGDGVAPVWLASLAVSRDCGS